MDDYFDWVVARLTPDQTLSTARYTGTPRNYCGQGTRLNQDAIVYSYLTHTGKIQRTFLNEIQEEFAAGHIPTREWCFAHGMDKGCSYCVTLQILTDYPQP